jgi:excisionase family DNA binding protein
MADKKHDAPARLGYTVAEAAEAVRLSVDSIQKAIKANEIAPKYYGTKPIIPVAEVERFFASLPDEKPERAA